MLPFNIKLGDIALIYTVNLNIYQIEDGEGMKSKSPQGVDLSLPLSALQAWAPACSAVSL
jgi:hypothetical protein